MNSPSVLIFSALASGLQVKINGDVYVLEKNRLYTLLYEGTDTDDGLILQKKLIHKKLDFTDFLTLCNTISAQEFQELHDILSQQGALNHA